MKLINKETVFSYWFITFCSLVSVSALSFAILNSGSNILDSKASAESQSASHESSAYTASIANDEEIGIKITPTPSQQIFTGTDDIVFNSTCPYGGSISIQTDSSSNQLTRVDEDNLDKVINAMSGTNALGNNTWGFSTDGTNFSAVPASGSYAVLYTSTKAETNKTIPVTFGVKIDNNLPSGTYTNNVVYTVSVSSNCLKYTLSFDLDGGAGASGVDYSDRALSYSDKINLSSYGTPTKNGYTFGGWTDGSTDFTGQETDIDINANNSKTVTLKAKWDTVPYTISYTLNGGSVSNANPTSYTIETSSFTLRNPTRSGYSFTGWSGTGISGKSTSVTIAKGSTGNRGYTANWETSTPSCTGIGCISTMQAMTSSICSATTVGTTKTLTDTRDNKTYTVFKGKDGKCWMSQNLRIVGKAITSTDSDVSSSFSIPSSNWPKHSSSSTKYSNPYVYDSGNTTDGVYYNYAAATAGTISGDSNKKTAVYSICPKGWTLPSLNDAKTLLSSYNVTNNASGSSIMRASPLKFVYSGGTKYDVAGSPHDVGTMGFWWTTDVSTVSGDSYPATKWRAGIYINSTTAQAVSSNQHVSARCSGYSIRCVAR